jgi:hypothetical protein
MSFRGIVEALVGEALRAVRVRGLPNEDGKGVPSMVSIPISTSSPVVASGFRRVLGDRK